jgi:hypothetical protein
MKPVCKAHLPMRLRSIGSTAEVLRVSRYLSLLLVILVCDFVGLATALPAQAGESPCPNEQQRGESLENPLTKASFSAQLPDCRAYELVSPPDTGDLPAIVLQNRKDEHNTLPPLITPSGAVFYRSEADPPETGALPNGRSYNVFTSSRSSVGWSTTDLDPFGLPSDSYLLAASPDGSRALIISYDSLSPEDKNEHSGLFEVRRDVYLVSPTRRPVLVSHGTLERGIPSPEDNAICSPSGRVVTSLRGNEHIFCLPGHGFSFNRELNAVGFESSAPLDPGLAHAETDETENAFQCYTWSDGGEQQAAFSDFVPSLATSRCLQLAMLPDGQPVFLDENGDAYEGRLFVGGADFPEGATQISGNTPGAASFDALSPDGKTAYVSTSDHLSAAAAEAEIYAVRLPVQATGGMPPPEEDVSCLSCGAGAGATFLGQSTDGSHVFFTTSEGLWSWDAASEKASLLTKDTELSHLVFSQNGQYAVALTRQLGTNPHGTADIYEFSVGQEPRLITSGASPDTYALYNTYEEEEPPTPHLAGAVSNDGRRVVYLDTPPGAPAVIDEYSSEQTLQISPAGASHPALLLGTSGGELHDVFFLANQPLVAQDQNAEWTAIYDAREGGGLPRPTPPEPGDPAPNPTQIPSTPYPPDLSALSVQPPHLPPDTSAPPSTPTPLSRAQKLAKALKACRALHGKRRRAVCQARARRRFGPAHAPTNKKGAS